MTDDDLIRLEVIKAALQGAAIATATACKDLSAESIQQANFTLPEIAWRMSQQILDLWHQSAPYAPPPKCVHGKLFTEDCDKCKDDSPPASEPPRENRDRVQVIGVEP
ncbi:MAG TPA: hypothetical protein VET48_04805 [Steroidobacteraceae bacterium]|nr:hypothetical protein [Steroidobacteraceae bacterium]